jgi:hypothetical protein
MKQRKCPKKKQRKTTEKKIDKLKDDLKKTRKECSEGRNR